MQALGFIETRGLVAAIESADAMLKAAEVRLVERTFVKGGIVTITITGDVAACKASVDAAAAAVTRMGGTILSTHVIPRPHESLDGSLIGSVDPIREKKEIKESEAEAAEEENPKSESEVIEDEAVKSESEAPEDGTLKSGSEAKKPGANRASVEGIIETDGIERAISLLKRFRTAEIKEMILDEYSELNLGNESVTSMTKKELLDRLKDLYID